MFGNKTYTDEEKKMIEDVNNVVVVTMDNVPNKTITKVVGLVAYDSGSLKKTETKLKKMAYELGANAVVGIKVTTVNDIISNLTGTAVIVE